MIPFEYIYRSLIAFASGIVPSGIEVVEGESYGVRFEDPRGRNPSVTVALDNMTEASLELGSPATEYLVGFTINAQSRRQRDAIKTIVYSGCLFNLIPIYSSFDVSGIPASGATITSYAEVADNIAIRDMPDFASERFFWTALAYFRVSVLS